MKLPDLDDLDYDPAGVYQALAGVEKADAKTQDCVALVLKMVSDKVQALSQCRQLKHLHNRFICIVEFGFAWSRASR